MGARWVVGLAVLLGVVGGTASADDCLSPLMKLSSCFQFVMPLSKASKPDENCCDALNSLLDSDAASGTHAMTDCMCNAFNGHGEFAVQINKTRALALADACYASHPANCTQAPAPAPATITLPSSTTVAPSSATGNHSSSACSSSLVASLKLLLCTTIFAAIFTHRPGQIN
ncbi:lipid-transfer protein [Striga asiatica]|uniref:Lipid-transfer protein n=1 Tax=Striga asiatica TaxID=4170 RepID=A0A5A7PCX8_STRAF|nr:lipid-transfer protein [Striga asiatica]